MKVPQAALVALALFGGTSLGDDSAGTPPADGTDGPFPDTNTTPDRAAEFPIPDTNTTSQSVPLVPGCPDAANAVCMEVYAPVCGSDGITYSNSCYFGLAQCGRPNLQVAKQGECGDGVVPDTFNVTSPGETGVPVDVSAVSMPQTGDGTTDSSATMDLCSDPANVNCPVELDPACGSDGITYSNSCYFGLAQCDRPDLEVANQGVCEEGSIMSEYEASGNYTIPWVSDDNYTWPVDDYFDDDLFGSLLFGSTPDRIVTCNEKNLADYEASGVTAILAQPSLMSCYESFGTGFSFDRRRLKREDEDGSDPYDALFEKIMSHEKCADMVSLMEKMEDNEMMTGQGTEEFNGYENGDFYSMIQGMSEVITEDLILDACAKSASAITCLKEVAMPEIISYMDTEDQGGCCVGVFQKMLASYEDLLDALDAVVCDTRYPVPGTDEVSQTCGYTLLQGLAAGEDLDAMVSNLLSWHQMPQDQACRAFAGESFVDTGGEESVLFPESPLRNCAEGHDKLFSWMKSDVEDMSDVLDAMSEMDETEDMAGLSQIMEALSLEDMFTEGTCFDVKTVVSVVMMPIMTGIGGMMGAKAAPPYDFGMGRALKEMESGRIRLGSVLAGVGRTVLRAGINNGSGNLRRRRAEDFDFMSLMLADMPNGDLIAKAMGMCIHFPTNFAASCGFPGPPEENKETEESMKVASSVGVRNVSFTSLLFAVAVSGMFLFA